jgi:hypothetical protein
MGRSTSPSDSCLKLISHIIKDAKKRTSNITCWKNIFLTGPTKLGRNGTPLYISMVSLGRGEPLIPIMRTLHLLGPLILYARVNWACKNEV